MPKGNSFFLGLGKGHGKELINEDDLAALPEAAAGHRWRWDNGWDFSPSLGLALHSNEDDPELKDSEEDVNAEYVAFPLSNLSSGDAFGGVAGKTATGPGQP